MDLKEFISETIVQIVAGVADAQSQTATLGGKVSPHITGVAEYAGSFGFLPSQNAVAQIAQFDVALTVKEGTGTKGGIGIVAGVVSLGSSGQSNSENSSVSRVKFSVPLILPNAE